ncbi:MAG: hypothetical protein KDD41_02045 [Flavobacteriales bacterium]|nr:hypothetical protein [Flavobacteriales bacterium]
MRYFLVLFLTISGLISSAQDKSFQEQLGKLIPLIEKSHSNMATVAMYQVIDKNPEAMVLTLEAKEENTIQRLNEQVELDFQLLDDFYALPTPEGVKLVVMFQEPLLFKEAKTEFANLFHEEIEEENLRENNEIWFNFQQEEDANDMESALTGLKKLLNSH